MVNEVLLDRIKAFEQLVQRGSREDFLESLAEGFDPEAVKEYEDLDEFGNPMGHGIPEAPEQTRQPVDFERTSPNGYATSKVVDIPATTIVGADPLIKQVQTRLIDLNIPVGKAGPDGILGPDTRAALEQFKARAPQYAGLTGKNLYDAVLRTTTASVLDRLIEKYGKKDKKKKLDPKAKVRNRGTVVFPAERTKDKKKDHFPINNIDQARNALSRSMQYDKVPSWYSGSLKSLQETVRRKVHKKYPGIEISKPKKKSSDDILSYLISKYAVRQ